jgi:PRC-barrel domain
MTKADVFALGTRGDHVTYLYFIVGDDHPVDQQLNQLSPLLEGGICKSATRRPLAISARRLSFRRRRRSCGIIGSTMWKRLLAGIFGHIGYVANVYVDDDGNYRFVDVATGGFIGLGTKHRLVPVEPIAEGEPGSITLKVDRRTIESATTLGDPHAAPDEGLQRAARQSLAKNSGRWGTWE